MFQEGTTSFAGQNPKQKRTKFMIIGAASKSSKSTRKHDPTAPKITRPCTECGKRFWSWKALFGHMRCHPERHWRGINPPPNVARHHDSEDSSVLTLEDHEAAASLLLLASGDDDQESCSTACTVHRGTLLHSFDYCYHHSDNTNNNSSSNDRGFECSSCKKVFGSHQALGGHRASHKNVKGCYAITKGNIDDQEHSTPGDDTHENQMIAGHRCTICMRVFLSGQALGGHMRCHWEKAGAEQEGGFDLNFPYEEHEYASHLSSVDSAIMQHPYLDLSLRL